MVARNDDRDDLIAPVCVCSTPRPDAIGECARCGRPYHPDNAAMMQLRHDWRTSGIYCEVEVPRSTDTQLSMFPVVVPDTLLTDL